MRLSMDKGVDYDSLKSLIESVRTKKLLKRNNYHQQKINDDNRKGNKMKFSNIEINNFRQYYNSVNR
jgi:hypothetical protein